MVIRQTGFFEPEVVALLELHHEDMVRHSPPGTAYVLDPQALRMPDIEGFAAWDAKCLLAIGALRQHDEYAEIKSMRAHPRARGTGAGKAILHHLLDQARARGNAAVRLETGSGPVFEAATGLYRSFGFAACDAFAGYRLTEFNRFYALEL